MKKTIKKQSNKNKNKSKNSNNYFTLYDDNKCVLKHCSKELKLGNKLRKINERKLKTLKCNRDIEKNHKFDKFNQVEIKYDYNPLHFPYNKITTSPCLELEHKLLNDDSIPIYKCKTKYCKNTN
jgi:hypothetical protein